MTNLFLSSFYLFHPLSLVSTTTKTLKYVAFSERLIYFESLLNLKKNFNKIRVVNKDHPLS